jgi:KUP system potassium uptake protein
MPEQDMSVSDAAASPAPKPQGPLALLTLSALGIVFGDIGTSPLYTLKTVLDATGANPTRPAVLGSLSLIIWTLIIVTSIKYVALAMRIDNDGEGGIMALLALLGIKKQKRRFIVLIGLFGAALIYGDGAITPAISVLSALEGLNILIPSFEKFVVPLAVVILIVLFALQRRGTAKIGGLFGPVMALWFLSIAVLGIRGLLLHPAVLIAINPIYGLSYLARGGWTAFGVLGGVFLCVTGAEALYADMGHFGARPIRIAWSALVLPSLVLSYAGQAALVLSGAPSSNNIFYQLCPRLLLPLLILLATVATIIASQAIITGAFSMTRQAIQLGWMPRLRVTQTSAQGYGQIYIGPVNYLLMLATLGLIIGFRKSDNLAAAYGIAVSLTMLMTTLLLFIAMREIWKWRFVPAALVAGGLLIVDLAFVSANMIKIIDGGYIPLLFAALVYGVMLVWHKGVEAIIARLGEEGVPIETLVAKLQSGGIARVPGTAVFLTRAAKDTPAVLIWYLKHSRALQERLFILNVVAELVPWISDRDRITFNQIAPNIWRCQARFGFMQRQDIPAVLAAAHAQGCGIDLSDLTYFVGHATIVRRHEGHRLPAWFVGLFSFLDRNSTHIPDLLLLPPEQVAEIGREIEI